MTKSSVDSNNLEMKKFYEFANKYEFDLSVFFDVMTYKENTIFLGDLQSNMYYISDRLKDMFGFESNIVMDLLSEWRKRIATYLEMELYDNAMQKILSGESQIHDLMYKVRDVNGIEHWISCQGKTKCEDNKPLFFAGKVTILDDNIDVDPITKLQRKDIVKLKILQYTSNKIGIIGFSLNKLRIINDTKGREYTDNFLKTIIDKISMELNAKISLYRIDGVKFLALVDEKHLNDIGDIANEIKDIVADLYFENNFIFKKSISIGIYVANKKSIVAENILDVFDKVMSKIKSSICTENVCVLSDNDILHRSYLNKIELELYRCVHSDFENFNVAIQPIVNEYDEISSAEVLLRWTYKGEFISPEIFIPILERTGLICQVGKFIFEEAAKISKEIKKYRNDFKLNVNISYIQILDDEFLPFIEAVLSKYDLSGREIVVELTENNYDEDKERVLDFANNCKSMGLFTAIDDFGVGYSSVSFLIKYHANVVKIDKSLIKESTKSEQNKQFLKGIISACKNFGTIVCAEGVEKEEELKVIRELKCDCIQGFYFFKPMGTDGFF